MGYMFHAIGPVVMCRRYLNHFDIIVPVSVLNAFMIFEFGDTWLYCLFLSTCVLQSVCVHTMDFVSANKQIN